MTRPWFGIVPPPKGQGYYPADIDFLPDYFVGKPPVTTTLTTNTTTTTPTTPNEGAA